MSVTREAVVKVGKAKKPQSPPRDMNNFDHLAIAANQKVSQAHDQELENMRTFVNK